MHNKRQLPQEHRSKYQTTQPHPACAACTVDERICAEVHMYETLYSCALGSQFLLAKATSTLPSSFAQAHPPVHPGPGWSIPASSPCTSPSWCTMLAAPPCPLGLADESTGTLPPLVPTRTPLLEEVARSLEGEILAPWVSPVIGRRDAPRS